MTIAILYSGGIIHFIAFAWVAYDVWYKNYGLSQNSKILWTVAAFFFSILTAIIYFFVGKSKSTEIA